MTLNRLIFVILLIVTLLLTSCGGGKESQAPELPVLLTDLPTTIPPTVQEYQAPTVEPTLEVIPTAPVLKLDDPAKARLTRALIATRAAELAMATMPGDYSWKEFRTCSTFVSAYLRQLSFPVDGLQGQNSNYPDPFPWSGTVEQVNWARRNYPQYTYDAPLQDFLDGKLWDRLMPGTVIYLQTAVGHNGYNSYFHTVVLVSYQDDGQPIFAELAGGMKNASTTRTFEQMTAFYAKDALGNWKIDPFHDPYQVSPPLLVTWFDPFAILNQGHLWQNSGPVVPNSDIVSANYDDLITINIYDGTSVIWEQLAGVWLPVPVEGHNQFYAVVGRFLPANNSIEKRFLQERKTEIYDGDYGVYYSSQGVFQNTWTPQMIARVTGFEVLSGFGGIGGSTFTALMTPHIFDQMNLPKDNWDYYSAFTFHRIPDVVNQDMLLRVDLLTAANTPGGPNAGPIPVPLVNLSSGCVNFDAATWTILKDYLQGQIDSGRRVGVIFSYPNYDQNLLVPLNVFKQPFSGGVFNQWCPVGDQCDGYDRRQYRQTYLGENGEYK